MLIDLIDSVFWIYMIMLFVRILGSWFPEYREHTVMLFISHYTDPYLNLFRQIIPPLGTIDLSPMVAFFSLHLIEMVVKSVAAALFL